MQQIASQTLTLIIRSVLRIVTTALPEATFGQAYNAVLAAQGGVTPYVWSLEPGSTLPDGLSLSSIGVISGTPTVSGSFSFTVRATDSGA